MVSGYSLFSLFVHFFQHTYDILRGSMWFYDILRDAIPW
jgi:hypothetical protein